MSETSNFKGFVEGTKTQIDDITDKDIDKYYIATDVELATKEYVDSAVGTGGGGGIKTVIIPSAESSLPLNAENNTRYLNLSSAREWTINFPEIAEGEVGIFEITIGAEVSDTELQLPEDVVIGNYILSDPGFYKVIFEGFYISEIQQTMWFGTITLIAAV